jgi:uncharacterized membrane protein YphA (DoxX/SURF4 family)
MTDLQKHSDHAALVGRILYASMFLLSGYGKITACGSGLPVPSLRRKATCAVRIR